MYFQWSFWFPLLFTIPIFLLSLLASRKFLRKKKKKIALISTAETDNNSSNSDPSSSASVYEVFLSFRSEDTRKSFTGFLDTYIRGASIYSWRGENALHVEELLKVIKQSKISIPIFSKNYAFSKWCLLELVQTVVECQKNMVRMIFLILCDVDPADLRNQSGDYKKSFHHAKKKFDEKMVPGWKVAMTLAGEMKGLELKKETNGHEGELVKFVVEKVLLELKKKYIYVPGNLVGIDHHLNRMEGLLSVNSNGVKFVGIHGMDGLGKTKYASISNAVASLKMFERSCSTVMALLICKISFTPRC